MQADTLTVGNTLYYEWGLPSLLVAVVVALAPVVYFLVSKKGRTVTRDYLRIRESLAAIFRSTLFKEVKTVFRKVEDHIPAALIEKGPAGDSQSRFDILAGKLADIRRREEIPPADGEYDDDVEIESFEEILHAQLAGIVTHRIDRLLDQIADEEPGEGDMTPARPRIWISFHEKTVDDFVLLAQAIHLTRRNRDRFFGGRVWAQRSWVAAVCSLAVLFGSILFNQSWAYWSGIIAVSITITSIVGCAVSCLIGIQAADWLEERANRPDAASAIRKEVVG